MLIEPPAPPAQQTTAAAALGPDKPEDDAAPPPGMSRGKRRRLAKRQALMARLDNVAKAAAEKVARRKAAKNPLLHVGTLAELLPDIPEPGLPGASASAGAGAGAGAAVRPRIPGRKVHQPASHKARRQEMHKEVGRMAQVMAHPVFSESPCQTLLTHLQNTVGKAAAEAEAATAAAAARGKKGSMGKGKDKGKGKGKGKPSNARR